MRTLVIFLLLFWVDFAYGQTASKQIPDKIDLAGTYLFYLHGGIVQSQGANAVSKDFGPYEYVKIVDSLKSYGYHVISEVRPKETEESHYAQKVAKQIDTLLKKGLPPEQIIVIGASQGGFITVETAHLLKNKKISYVVMAICNEYNLNFYKNISKSLCGNFLSIYERSDNKGTCNELFNKSNCINSYKEIKLDMGNGHGFIFRPYKEWIDPIVNWKPAKSK